MSLSSKRSGRGGIRDNQSPTCQEVFHGPEVARGLALQTSSIPCSVSRALKPGVRRAAPSGAPLFFNAAAQRCCILVPASRGQRTARGLNPSTL